MSKCFQRGPTQGGDHSEHYVAQSHGVEARLKQNTRVYLLIILLVFMCLLTPHAAVMPSTMPGVPLHQTSPLCPNELLLIYQDSKKKHQLIDQMYTKQMLTSFYGSWMTPINLSSITDDPYITSYSSLCMSVVCRLSVYLTWCPELITVKCQEPHLLFLNYVKASYLILTLPRVLWVALGKLFFLSGPMATPISAQE